MRPTVAVATCAAFPDLEEDDQPLLPALRARGLDATAVAWDDPEHDWAGDDLVVVRNTWDYTDRLEAFLAWADSVPRLANPAPVLRWNTDKRYLADLAAAGVPVTPTTYVAPGDAVPRELLDGEVVVKPTVSAGSRDTLRLEDPDAVAAQVAHIHGLGKTAMIQPYLDAVDTAGETAVVFLGGEHSHAARKGPLLPLGRSLVDGLYAPELMTPRAATDAELDVARAALEVVPGDLLYARVDLLLDGDGRPVVLEVEVTEPTLFLAFGGPDAVDRLATAIHAHLRRSRV